MNWRLFAIAIFVAVCCGDAAADIYKWTDEDGQVHFSQTKPAGLSDKDVQIRKGGTDRAPGKVKAVAPLRPKDCSEGQDFFINGESVVCCNRKCVEERHAKGLGFDCYSPACNAVFQEIRAEEDRVKQLERQKKIDEQFARNREFHENATAEMNKKIVDECNSRHETYCNEGAKKIDQREMFKEWKANGYRR